jgi:predicted RNA-binding Zn-ribbon protein involved in translation (DUF1610 family)
MRILIYDIETSPSTVYTWGHRMYDEQVIKVVKDWELLSVAYKWLGDDKVKCITRQNEKTDKKLATALWGLLNEADIVVAHNGIRFDNKKSFARFIKHGMTPPSPFKTIDTKVVCKNRFGFTSNRLDDVAKFLKLGEKFKHNEGFELWENVMLHEPSAWRTMVKYNKQDVEILERVYLRLRPYITSHPVAHLDKAKNCPSCGSTEFARHGYRRDLAGTYRRVSCMGCGAWLRERKSDPKKHVSLKYKAG